MPLTPPHASLTHLVNCYRWLRQYGINDSHSGNASVRLEQTVWITPTGACADTLTETDLIACPLDAPPSAGASLDAALHLAVYRHNPTTQAVLHSHGSYTLAMTMGGDDFIPIDFEGNLYFPRVPVISLDYAKYVAESPLLVAKTLMNYPITIVRGHGVYAHAQNLNLAYKWTCSLEQSAKTAYLAKQLRTVA